MTRLVDFESRSRADLKAGGGRNYWADPSTEALCAVLYDTETGAVDVWAPGMPCPVRPDEELAAHNATGFDRFAAERLGWPAIELDTSEAARRAGLPGALDALGSRWLGIPKDKAASAFTKGLSTCRRPSGKGPDAIAPAVWKALSKAEKRARGVMKPITPAVMARVIPYCVSDVEIMAHGWDRLEPFLREDIFGGWEADVCAVDRIVNDRGVAFDSDLARRLLAVDARNGEIAIDRAARAWGESFEATRDLVFSPVELASVLGTADATAETIEAVAKEGGERGLLAEARIAIATITAGKLRAGLAGVSPDGRLRDMLRYYGAHTGRWSGKRLQPHNFTRPPRHLEDWKAAEIEAAIRDVQRGQIVDNDVLAILMRACITVAPGNTLVTEDFSGVEARALAWCAGDQRALDVFKSGRDPYKVEASELYRVPYDQINKVQRGIGKVMVLALGYGMGYAKFYANNAAALDAAGLNAKAVVKAWRTLHAPIVQYWKRLNDAFVAAVDGRATRVAPFDFIPSNDGNDVAVFLPSGRPIIYNAVGVSRDGRWPDGRPKTSPYYIGTKGNREHLYGGKLAENMVQALCRDLLAEALIKAEEAGLCPVLHVHDEIVCEVPEQVAEEAADELHRIMTTVPEWAEGFPAAGAGHTGKRYRK